MNKKMGIYGLLRTVHRLFEYSDLLCYGLFLNLIIFQKKSEYLGFVAGLYLGSYFLETFLCVIEKQAYNKIFPLLMMETKDALMKKYIQLDLKQIREYIPSDLKTMINEDTEKLTQYYMKKIEIFVGAVHMFIVLVILFSLDQYLAGFCIIVLPVSFMITKYISSKSSAIYRLLRDVQIHNDNFLFFSIQHWKTIRLNGIKDHVCKEYDMFCNKIGKLSVKTHMYWFLNRTFLAFKDAFVTKMSLYFVGGILVMKGYSEIPVLLVFVQCYDRLMNAMVYIGDLRIDIEKEKEAKNKIQSILDHKKQDKLIAIEENVHTIELCDGVFFYDRDLIIDHLNLNIEKGKNVGIVGKSGCGKSTLLKLLTGIEEVKEGEVLINSIPIEKIDPHYLYEKIGIIMQDSYLFHLSIKENLLFGKETATEEEMRCACKKANILGFILSLENGFETVIGENGMRLSQGQRQRLVIARMLLHDPEIIFFDEATNALDSENEDSIIQELMGEGREKTYVIVSHNMDTIKKCDKVYVIENGKAGKHKVK